MHACQLIQLSSFLAAANPVLPRDGSTWVDWSSGLQTETTPVGGVTGGCSTVTSTQTVTNSGTCENTTPVGGSSHSSTHEGSLRGELTTMHRCLWMSDFAATSNDHCHESRRRKRCLFLPRCTASLDYNKMRQHDPRRRYVACPRANTTTPERAEISYSGITGCPTPVTITSCGGNGNGPSSCPNVPPTTVTIPVTVSNGGNGPSSCPNGATVTLTCGPGSPVGACSTITSTVTNCPTTPVSPGNGGSSCLPPVTLSVPGCGPG